MTKQLKRKQPKILANEKIVVDVLLGKERSTKLPPNHPKDPKSPQLHHQLSRLKLLLGLAVANDRKWPNRAARPIEPVTMYITNSLPDDDHEHCNTVLPAMPMFPMYEDQLPCNIVPIVQQMPELNEVVACNMDQRRTEKSHLPANMYAERLMDIIVPLVPNEPHDDPMTKMPMKPIEAVAIAEDDNCDRLTILLVNLLYLWMALKVTNPSPVAVAMVEDDNCDPHKIPLVLLLLLANRLFLQIVLKARNPYPVAVGMADVVKSDQVEVLIDEKNTRSPMRQTSAARRKPVQAPQQQHQHHHEPEKVNAKVLSGEGTGLKW